MQRSIRLWLGTRNTHDTRTRLLADAPLCATNALRLKATRACGMCVAGVTSLFCMAFPSAAQETQTVEVLGSITADLVGENLEWLTISGGIEDMEGASAIWLPHSMSLPDVLANQMGQMSEQRRAAMDMVAEMMGEANPLAGAEGLVDVRITGFDPEADRMLREGVLSIEVRRFPAGDMDAAPSTSHEADVSYFRNRGPDTGLYVSAHSVGVPAQVEFDQLNLGDQGNAQGRFSATLCPISTLMGGEVDADLCVLISGEFTTELMEEAPSHASQ